MVVGLQLHLVLVQHSHVFPHLPPCPAPRTGARKELGALQSITNGSDQVVLPVEKLTAHVRGEGKLVLEGEGVL